MPIIHYLCECGHPMGKFFRSPKDAPLLSECIKCKKEAKKVLKAPSSTSTIIVDNGVQARAVEVNLEVVEDIKDRSSKDFSEK
jgi:hypothetical protein